MTALRKTTLHEVERVQRGVSMGIDATLLFVLGLADRLADLADVRSDQVGLRLDEEKLPQRVRQRSKPAWKCR
jgi:hypothetical protein